MQLRTFLTLTGATVLAGLGGAETSLQDLEGRLGVPHSLATSSQAMVASITNPVAIRAGLDALKAGGRRHRHLSASQFAPEVLVDLERMGQELDRLPETTLAPLPIYRLGDLNLAIRAGPTASQGPAKRRHEDALEKLGSLATPFPRLFSARLEPTRHGSEF